MTDHHKGELEFRRVLFRSGQLCRSMLTSGPSIVWVTVFLLAPLVIVGIISFLTRGTYGEIERVWTIENYKRLVGFGAFGFDPLYPQIILRSLLMGAGTAALCVMAGLPLAFFVAGLPPRYKNLALTLVIIPFWTNLD